MGANGTFIFACGAERQDPVSVTFADSERSVPGWIVSHYGGSEKLLADAAVFAQVTYADFIRSFEEAVGREHLNEVQAEVVSRHLRLRF